MIFQLRDRTISTSLPSFIMGIVNCTPDSFFSESRGGLERALRLIDEGADILDLGAESTRPGSSYVSENEEIERLIPVIKEIRKRSNIPISVDTRKLSVMREAFNEGADILNDISALSDDKDLAPFIAEKGLPVILMHKKGIPEDMQKNTEYRDVFSEVKSYLENRAENAVSMGIKKDRIILDPGIGFGKDVESNAVLIRNCGKLSTQYPILMALSRKSFLGKITGKKTEDLLASTLTANMLAVLSGATFLRVHDVSSCKDSLSVLKYIHKYESV